MAEIFLSYRRKDSQSATGRLGDDLEAQFGDDRVFRDVEIAAGDDFVEAIRRSVESSTVVLAVVGPHWLGATDAHGRRRLDDRSDFVRLEIELALAARVPIVPVLVEGAAMPLAAELPPSLDAFARCQAVELADQRWRHDVATLIETLRSRFAITSAIAPPAPEGRLGVALVRVASDLLELALHPRRLIARRQTGRASDHLRAFAFLCGAILAGNATLLAAIDVRIVAQGSPASVVLGVAGWLLVGLLVGLLAAGILVATLSIAWRIVDRDAGYRRVGLVGGYVYGGAWIGFCAGAAVAVSAVALFDPDFIERAIAALQATTAGAVSPPPAMRPLETAPFRFAATMLLLLAAAIWLVSAVWSVAAWGAFRQAFGATRRQSVLATALWVGLLVALWWLASRLT
ncbi:MAG TPA: toll/interleukin-1 receptor domain-containing protein [Caldimonas sp.]